MPETVTAVTVPMTALQRRHLQKSSTSTLIKATDSDGGSPGSLTPLVAGGKAMIPDFLFERFGRKVYFEIVGFWTREYLERKAEKLQALLDGSGSGSGSSSGKNDKGVDLLVAINSELACSKIEAISKERIFTFQKDVSIKPVLEHLKKIDAEIVEEKIHTRIRLDGDRPDLISIRQVALENSLPEAAALRILLADHPGDYVAVGSYLISKEKIKAADDCLGGVSRFVDACKILASQKIPDSCHADLLSKMGYDVVWGGSGSGQCQNIKGRDEPIIPTNGRSQELNFAASGQQPRTWNCGKPTWDFW